LDLDFEKSVFILENATVIIQVASEFYRYGHKNSTLEHSFQHKPASQPTKITIPGLKYDIKEVDRSMKMKKPKEKLNISRKVNIGSIQLPPLTSTQRYWKRTMINNSRK
jgi:hypothetical protein